MKKLFLSFAIALSLGVGGGTFLPAAASAASPTDAAKSSICEGVNGQSGGKCSGGGADLNAILVVVLNIISTIGGVLAVIMIIVAGIKYITSGGDAQAVASAKKTLIYAIVGLILVAAAQIIVRFVLTELENA